MPTGFLLLDPHNLIRVLTFPPGKTMLCIRINGEEYLRKRPQAMIRDFSKNQTHVYRIKKGE